MQRAFCQHSLPTLTFTIIGSGTAVPSLGNKGNKPPRVTFACGPTHTHVKDLTAWDLRATLRISTCIHHAFLAVYRHDHLTAKEGKGSRQRDQHRAGNSAGGSRGLGLNTRPGINNFRVNARPPLPSLSPLPQQASSYS